MPQANEVKYGAIVEAGPEGTSLCVIVKHYQGEVTVVRIGVEKNHNDAAQWGANTIKFIRKMNDEKAHMPDATQRGEMAVSVTYGPFNTFKH